MQKRSDLTAARLREALDYDPATGIFRWKKRISIRITIGSIAGSTGGRVGHREIGVYGVSYLAHRLAWLWMTGEWPPDQVDHIDMNGDNNRWLNLRFASHAQNIYNTKRRRNNTSGFKGVSYIRKLDKWHARIMADRTLHLLGYFKTKAEASRAYQEAAARLHGEFRRAS